MIKYIELKELNFKREEGSCSVTHDQTGNYPVYMNYKLKKHLVICWDNEGFECSLCCSKNGDILIHNLSIEQVKHIIKMLGK